MYASVTADVYNSAAVWWQIAQPLRKRVTTIVQWKEEKGSDCFSVYNIYKYIGFF